MRRAVIHQNRIRRQCERTTEDLNEEHATEGDPDEEAGSLGGWGRGGWHNGEVGRKEVGKGEEAEEPAIGAKGTKDGVDLRVDGELEGDANAAENSHSEADGTGLHAEAASEGEREGLCSVKRGRWVGGIEAGGGEEDEPKIVEGADVEGEEEVSEEHEEDVAREYAAEWKLVLCFVWFEGGEGCGGCERRGGRARFEVVAFNAGDTSGVIQVEGTDRGVFGVVSVEKTAGEV